MMEPLLEGGPLRSSGVFRSKLPLGAKKRTNKQKTHKHFSDGPCGTIVPATHPHPSQGQTGQNGDFTVELNRKRPVCPRDGSQFVPGRGPVCPRDGLCLSQTPSRPKCLCLLVFFLPDSRNFTSEGFHGNMHRSRQRLRSLTEMVAILIFRKLYLPLHL